MNSAFYSAVSGMKAFQSELDVTANNLSNVNTTGFKVSKVSFDELMKTQMNTKAPGQHLVGHGTKVGQVKTASGAGNLVPSDSRLDFAIIGDAYFAVEGGENEEEPLYTRDGSFQISATEDGNYLTTKDGCYVLGMDGDYIELEYKTIEKKSGSGDRDDRESGRSERAGSRGGREEETNILDLDGLKDRIGLFTCDNPAGLIAVGSNRFRSSATSGEWYEVEAEEAGEDGTYSQTPHIIAGALEGSNADIGTEMVSVIESQRGFQLNSRIVTVADQLEEMINNLR